MGSNRWTFFFVRLSAERRVVGWVWYHAFPDGDVLFEKVDELFEEPECIDPTFTVDADVEGCFGYGNKTCPMEEGHFKDGVILVKVLGDATDLSVSHWKVGFVIDTRDWIPVLEGTDDTRELHHGARVGAAVGSEGGGVEWDGADVDRELHILIWLWFSRRSPGG